MWRISNFQRSTIRRQNGFGLIEIMLGLALGLLIVLGVVKIYANSDARQRNIGAKNDAQMVASIASYALEQDIRLGGRGFGYSEPNALGCNVPAYDSVVTPPDVPFQFLPVFITDGANGAPDQITVLYSSSPIRVNYDYITFATATEKELKSRKGILVGDKVLFVNATKTPAVCALVEVTARGTDNITISHLTTPYLSDYEPAGSTNLTQPVMNTSAGTGANTDDFMGTDVNIYNLGQSPQLNIWSLGTPASQPSVWTLNRRNMLPVNVAAAQNLEVAEGIVNLQAQYGYDVNDDGIIKSSEWFDAGLLPTPTEWRRVLAVRFAILARSAHYEPPPFRANPPFWAGGAFVMRNLSGGADSDPPGANNWRSYRYQVMESVVPLRNNLQQWR